MNIAKFKPDERQKDITQLTLCSILPILLYAVETFARSFANRHGTVSRVFAESGDTFLEEESPHHDVTHWFFIVRLSEPCEIESDTSWWGVFIDAASNALYNLGPSILRDDMQARSIAS